MFKPVQHLYGGQMNNTLTRINNGALNYIWLNLCALVPIPFIVLILYTLGFQHFTIVTVAFLCSVVVIEWIYFKDKRFKS